MPLSRTSQAIAGITLALLVVLLYGALLRMTFTSGYRGANDFFIPWRAIQALLWEDRNPYGADVTAEIQQTIMGRTLGPDEHQFDYAYPLTLAPLLAPYTLFSYEWAQPLWQATLHLFLLVGLLFWLRSWHSRWPPPLLLAALLLWTLSIYPAARAFVLGQVALLIFFAVALAIWAIEKGHDRLAGGALAVSLVKPQISFLVVPLLLFLAWSTGRRRLLAAFGVVLGGLLLLSLLLLPEWPLLFLRRLAEYSHYTGLGKSSDSPSVLEMALRLLGPLDHRLVKGLLSLLLVAPLLRLGWRARRAPDWCLLAGLAVTITALIAPRTATTDQTLLLLPLLWLLGYLPRWQGMFVAAALWLGGWLFFLLTLQGDTEALELRLLLPVAVVALWLWLRPTGRAIPSPPDHPPDTP